MEEIKFGTLLIYNNGIEDERLVVMGIKEGFVKIFNVKSETTEWMEISELKRLINNNEIFEIINY
ncbi:MAG: hypothetical protein SPJ27_04545 [Candidatus Onthovivens sp.]|nr:hypothetical protein [Candidatus Onthovivens sp.]